MRIADILTSIRIILTPFIIWLLLRDERVVAYYLFAAGAITDTLDGYFARKSSKKVTYGHNFDALADFFFGFSTIFVVVYVSKAWMLLLLTLIGISFWTPIIYLISRKAGNLDIPHLETNLLAAAVYPVVMAYIIEWRFAWLLLLFTAVVLVFYMRKYYLFVKDLYRTQTS